MSFESLTSILKVLKRKPFTIFTCLLLLLFVLKYKILVLLNFWDEHAFRLSSLKFL